MSVTHLRWLAVVIGIGAAVAVGAYMWVASSDGGREPRSLLIATVTALAVSSFTTWLISKTIRVVTGFASDVLRHLVDWLHQVFSASRERERRLMALANHAGESLGRTAALLEQVSARVDAVATRVEDLARVQREENRQIRAELLARRAADVEREEELALIPGKVRATLEAITPAHASEDLLAEVRSLRQRVEQATTAEAIVARVTMQTAMDEGRVVPMRPNGRRQ